MSIYFYLDIDKILKQRRWTLSKLAEETGISITQLCNIRASKRASLNTVNKIASSLNEKDLSKILSFEENSK
ncbi:XRE family transcriptional regulator [Halobacillus trueperi]|uniref:XRE family transcriptional regulator n=1 Tax=Halobacillus trueperi TaxID=156205 RepID=A0A3D8VT09_9BACI|nr:helix-turn-helix transcriptional regulator [Halobacillus trueperi]RDY72564.1 XRE family transcriptional regulator [Halobacillus trueperi]